MIRVDADTPVAVEASSERNHITGCQINAQTFCLRILSVISFEICNILLNITLNTSQLLVLVSVTQAFFGNTSFNRDEHRLVILVSELVHHYQNLAQLRQNVEIVSIHQMRVYQRLAARKKRLRNAAFLVHRIEAENTTEIGEKEHFVPDNLWS